MTAITLLLAGCSSSPSTETPTDAPEVQTESVDAVEIALSDSGSTVDGQAISASAENAVYSANDIVFYLAGQGFTYGEGTEADEHSQEEADAHTVVHITKPGTYSLSGKLSAGQIAIDLGEDAEDDPNAVVTLILDNADITCSVAPAVIFYNVYECGEKDEETATKDVDTSAAGANVIIADGSYNKINGSYVARIYKSYELSEDGTEVVDSKKLHKYDAAFYSKMSMNVNGGANGSGVLDINAENEGLDSELHLTVNGGIININSGNDGINTNEDNISVTTINGGELNITVNGSTGEGDGIDSNGWLVINGGILNASACGFSGDAGIDSDMGIYINGGKITASGNMLDRIEQSDATYAVFTFASSQNGGNVYEIKNSSGETVIEAKPENSFTYLIVSHEDLTEGTYTLWQGETQFAGLESAFGGAMQKPGMFNPNGQMPEDMTPPEDVSMPQDMQPPEDMSRPEGMTPPDGSFNSENGETPSMPDGGFDPSNQEMPELPEGASFEFDENKITSREKSTSFDITKGANTFTGVSPVQ